MSGRGRKKNAIVLALPRQIAKMCGNSTESLVQNAALRAGDTRQKVGSDRVRNLKNLKKQYEKLH